MPATADTARKRASKDGIEAVRERFMEQMGIDAKGDGVPRIAGRMMGLMVLDGRPYSFSELSVELQVSRGSVSANARVLEQQGIIERTAVPGDRQDYFQLAESPYDAILTGALARSRKAREMIARTVDALPAGGQSAPKRRLEEFASFHESIVEALETAIPSRG